MNGPELRAERLRRGLTQMQMSKQMGVAQTTLSALESKAEPKSDLVVLYLKALDELSGTDWISPDVLAERERIKAALLDLTNLRRQDILDIVDAKV